VRPFYDGRLALREVPESGTGPTGGCHLASIGFFHKSFFQCRGSLEEPRQAAPGALFIGPPRNCTWEYLN
jgi:hypothetical protein